MNNATVRKSECLMLHGQYHRTHQEKGERADWAKRPIQTHA